MQPGAALTTHLLATAAGPIEWIGRAPEAAASGGSIVLVHGIQGTAASWREVAGRLDGRRHILVPNLRGRGRSHAPAGADAYGLAGFADDLAAILALAPKPVVLVGWSMGVLVALTTLRRRGTAGIDRLILASGTARPGDEAVWFRAQSADELIAEAEARARRLALAEYAAPVAVAGAWAAVRGVDLEPDLPALDIPTLVLHGEADAECPLAHGRRIAALIPGARFDAWAGAGHNLMAHDPQRFAGAILRFCAAESRDADSAFQ